MANKLKKIKEELINQYTETSWIKDKREYTSQCIKDYSDLSRSESMVRAFMRGFGNCESVFEEAVKKWAKKNNLNASNTLFQIKQEFDDEKIKLK